MYRSYIQIIGCSSLIVVEQGQVQFSIICNSWRRPLDNFHIFEIVTSEIQYI
jgi:hypothetical protein